MKLKEQAADGRFYAAICAAPAVALGSWGLLKEKKQLSSSAITFESRVQQDGKVVTSRGPGTAIEFSVVLVEQLSGKDKADEVSGPWTGFIHVAECKITCFLRDAKLGELTAQKQVICPNHGDEYDVLELNPMEWTFDNCPKGKKATAFPAMCDKLSDKSEVENIVVVDGNLIHKQRTGNLPGVFAGNRGEAIRSQESPRDCKNYTFCVPVDFVPSLLFFPSYKHAVWAEVKEWSLIA
ncbi:protein DJ-1 homolog B-like isoform X1 [Actinidia eriantha]|uniref:protein DJ-1 homolog B-like isoform X1 n=1 Tax=Actinidia eriantha TaxID=165200 RepID=UPI00258647D1|nr:protein DJ-1 homolog B-like isoform X1 [Actinidia eriantha]XP_057461281.1 protein DJ-1 homolog B-like isoform X1 [Actinidia eriantha]XP_057461282.1 protein DJ-1 homolog B-like isoform X1 [Actinidia eriantha]XP_057461283.1 protein DJ-1 homolog B-like isoform X1 [Actinidia eriantha]